MVDAAHTVVGAVRSAVGKGFTVTLTADEAAPLQPLVLVAYR